MSWPFSRLPGRSRVEYGTLEDFREFQRKLRAALFIRDHMRDGDVLQVAEHVWLMKRGDKFYLIQAESGEEAEITPTQAYSAIMYGIGKGIVKPPPGSETYLAK